jgi:hypothetical protein
VNSLQFFKELVKPSLLSSSFMAIEKISHKGEEPIRPMPDKKHALSLTGIILLLPLWILF